jgi:hypothetical protein
MDTADVLVRFGPPSWRSEPIKEAKAMLQPVEQNQLDLRLFRIWAKASRTVFENVRKDIENHGISQEQ